MGKTRRQSPKEAQKKIEQAKKREQAAKKAKERKERNKKILTVVVCVILILGLCIPTMALSVCSVTNNQAKTEQAE